MAVTKSIEVSLEEKSIVFLYTDLLNGAQQKEYYPVCSMKGVRSVPILGVATRNATTNQRASQYHHVNQLEIELVWKDQTIIQRFDIQDVTNQAGWTSDLAGLAQAAEDINVWLAECGGGSASTDALLQDVVDNTQEIDDQFTGAVEMPPAADISLNGAYAIPAATYNSIQIVVNQGVVTRGDAVYDEGVWPITAPLNKTLPAITLDASGSTDAFVEFMTP